MNRTFVTHPYRTGSGHYIRTVAGLWAARWWWTIALPITACFIFAATNIAFAFVALMILFIIIPMIISFLYFYYALTPEAIMAMRNKRIHFSTKDITITYEPANEEDSTPAYPPAHIDWNDVISIEYRSRDMILHLKGSRYRFLLIPYEAIGSREQQTELNNILSSFD